MCILKYLNRKLFIIKYEIPSEIFRYKKQTPGKKITGPWVCKLSKRHNTNRIEKFTILTRFFTLDRRLCTMKLSSIKPYLEFKELSISEFIKSYIKYIKWIKRDIRTWIFK